MSDLLKLSTALPGDQEINGLDALAAALVEDPSRMVCAVLILDVKDVRYITDVEAHVPTMRFRRGEAWLVDETPEEVRLAMVQRSEERTGRTPLPFGEVETKKADKDRPDPHDCDHVDFTVERDHLEDVPEGMVRETCLRCGWVQYQPADTLEERMEASGLGKDDDAPTLTLVEGGGRSDVGEVFVFEGGDSE